MKQEDIDDDIARGQNWVSLFFSTFVWVRSMSMDFSRIASRCERKREGGGGGGTERHGCTVWEAVPRDKPFGSTLDI